MHSTRLLRACRRRLDRRVPAALVLTALGALGGAAASCAANDDPEGVRDANGADASPETGAVADAETDSDAGRVVSQDAATSDAAPEPVVCASPQCATALVTPVSKPGIGSGAFCALLEDKTVACWGDNHSGQLGLDPNLVTGVPGSAVPVRVTGLTDIRQLERGCAIDGSGDTWCWGTGPYLQSTDSPTTTAVLPVKLPIPPATAVSVGWYTGLYDWQDYYVGCALVDTGLTCWGTNGMGHLGPREFNLSVTKIFEPRTIALPAGPPVERLFVGWAAFGLRADGSAVSWGANPPLARVSSLYPDPYPRSIPLAGISELDGLDETVCAVAQGIGYCWGANLLTGWADPMNQTDLLMAYAKPAPIVTPEPIVDIATTSLKDRPLLLVRPGGRGCAVGVSGDVYCWGPNESGQVGDGSREYATSPVKVAGLPGRASRVKVTLDASCALLVSGDVYCWGDNAWGQLGDDNMKVPSAVPHKVLLP